MVIMVLVTRGRSRPLMQGTSSRVEVPRFTVMDLDSSERRMA